MNKYVTAPPPTPAAGDKPLVTPERLTHLQRLEAESIQIMREVVAECDKPVMLYSIGKDSAAMLHVALKAFYPAPLPFPLLHVDTLWKFQAMYKLRAEITQRYKLQLIVHTNPDGVAQGVNPFTHGSAVHTDVMKTQALKQALDLHGFNAAFGGGRRDEEKSRAKERVFSFRSAQHRWDPKNQRPELWSLYNTRMHKGESLRVFPMSNWTELDIWQYIYLHDLPIVPLYYAAERPVVERDGTLIMVDDDRMPLRPGEQPMLKKVRFRTLGCYPLTGAIESEADTLTAIIQEMLLTTHVRAAGPPDRLTTSRRRWRRRSRRGTSDGHISDMIATDIHAYLHAHEHKSLLRFITCGSVDDGKSTLIGRLLYDSKMIFEDQLAALEADSKKVGTQGGELDFALLVDGLAAEREQGITIDVAYRFFSTDKRKFIVADTPGHEQYTRNMVTGASTADLAVILIDARKGVLTQTRRHSYLVSLLGIRKVVLAINKMDLVGYDEETFRRIVDDYRAVRRADRHRGRSSPSRCPACAATTSSRASENTPWYDGPALMDYLENVEIEEQARQRPLRLPVQWVNRPNLDFRGFAGTLASGIVRQGERIRVLPSGRESTVTRIVTMDGDLDHAVAGQSVTLTLADEIDISRGDVIASPADLPGVADQFECVVVWMSDEPMLPGRPYWLKIGTRQVAATITEPKYKVNVNTLEHLAAKKLELNEIGICNLSLDQPVAFDAYDQCRETGSFILIDRISNATVGAGMIHFALRRSQNIHWQALDVNRATRAAAKGQKPGGPVAHRPVGRGQVDHREPGREEAAVARQAHLPARRRQRAPWAQPRPRLHRRGPCREHPSRGRSQPADDRCGPDRAGQLHFAVPRRAAHGAQPVRRRRVLRGVRRHHARDGRGP